MATKSKRPRRGEMPPSEFPSGSDGLEEEFLSNPLSNSVPTPGPPQISSEESDGSDSDDSGSGSGTTSVSSTPDAVGAFRRKFNRLIDDCRKLERKEGFSKEIQNVMTKNIECASSLFKQLSDPRTEEISEANHEQYTDNVGSAPGDIYMAFLHTKRISDVLRTKTDAIGASNAGFKFEEFLSGLKAKCFSEEDSNAFCPDVAGKTLRDYVASSCTTLPFITAVVGSFDRDAIIIPKEKKPRAPIVRKKFDDVEKGQEEVNSVVRKTEGPQKLALHLNRILKQYARSHSRPTKLYEFVLDSSSLNKTIESIFYVAFLVHDGVAGLHKPVGSPLKDFAVELKPEAREEEEQHKSQISSRKSTRSQYILSFSSKMFKKLCQVAKGEPVIPPYTTFEDEPLTASPEDLSMRDAQDK